MNKFHENVFQTDTGISILPICSADYIKTSNTTVKDVPLKEKSHGRTYLYDQLEVS